MLHRFRRGLRYVQNRYSWLPLLLPPTEGLPCDDLCKIYSECQRMAKVYRRFRKFQRAECRVHECYRQGCGLGLDVSVSRPSRDVSVSRLDENCQRLGLGRLTYRSRPLTSRAHPYYRQTDGRAIAYSDRECEFTFTKNMRIGYRYVQNWRHCWLSEK